MNTGTRYRSHTSIFLLCSFLVLMVPLRAQSTFEAPLHDRFDWSGGPVMLQFLLQVPSDWPFWDAGIGARAGDLISVSADTSSACNPSPSAERRDISRDLPVSIAGFGALIGRLGNGEPFLIGQHLFIKSQNSAQLFLGANTDGEPVCSGNYEVQVSIFPARTGSGSGDFPSQLISQLGRLPRRLSDSAGHPGDMLNFVLIGSEATVKAALESGNWVLADETKLRAAVHAVLTTWARESYVQMPMSKLYCFGRVQDYGYEMAQAYRVAASRHHFRLWHVPWQFEGKDVWIGAATHDVGFAKDRRNGHLTHKIDPNVDNERDFVSRGLESARTIDSKFYFTPEDAIVNAQTATGDRFYSDGRVLVIILK